MSFIRSLVLTTVLLIAPVAAMAQTGAPAPAVSPQPPMTQDVTVVDPNMDALKPPPRPAMTQPRWSEFPVAPKAVPTVADFAGRVHKELADNAVLATIGRAIVWEAYQPGAITAAVNAQLDPSKFGPIDTEMTPQQTDALAQSLRAQATAPAVAQ
jgi:hypothetical protein